MGLFNHDHKHPLEPPPDYKPPPFEQQTSYQPQFAAGPSTHRPTFASLLLSRTDRVRLIGFPADVVGPVDEAIKRVWTIGIQNQGPVDAGGWEWKLSGNPWRGISAEAVPARRLVLHMIHSLATVGWHLHTSTDLTKKGFDKDTLIFKSGPRINKYYFVVSFNESDKVRLIDSPNEGVTQAFSRAIMTWPAGIQDQKIKESGCLQIKLRGNPWFSSAGAEVNQARLLVCALLSELDAEGYELVGSVDLSIGAEGRDLDSWFFAAK